MTNEELIHHLERKMNHYSRMAFDSQIDQSHAHGAINVLTELIHEAQNGLIDGSGFPIAEPELSIEQEDFIDEILDGAGWATDDYVENFSPDEFTAADILAVKKELARIGKLHCEELLTDDMIAGSEEPNDSTRISPENL
jgi:hypothetical protein